MVTICKCADHCRKRDPWCGASAAQTSNSPLMVPMQLKQFIPDHKIRCCKLGDMFCGYRNGPLLTPVVSRNVGIPELMALAKILLSKAVRSSSVPPALFDLLLLLVELLLLLQLGSLPTPEGATSSGDCIDGKDALRRLIASLGLSVSTAGRKRSA